MQTVTASPSAYEYTIMQKLAPKWLVGCSLGYIPMYAKINTGYSMRYFRNNYERYYLQYMQGMQQLLSLGGIWRLDQNSLVGTELEIA